MLSSLLFRANRTLRPRPSRLSVEILEERDCPSSLTLDCQVLPGHDVHLSGSVQGDFLPGSIVVFTGAATGVCEVDTSGHYSFDTTFASLGGVTAQGVFGFKTATATATIATPAPALTLSVSGMTATTVSFSGKLTDVDATGQLISINGGVDLTPITDAHGNFTLTLPRQELGVVAVSETDLWGQTGGASYDSANLPPFIDGFGCRYNDTTSCWTFSGMVYGNNVGGLVVTFSGIPALEGRTATVNEDGSFGFTIDLGENAAGTVTASTMQNGVSSNEATTTLIS